MMTACTLGITLKRPKLTDHVHVALLEMTVIDLQ